MECEIKEKSSLGREAASLWVIVEQRDGMWESRRVPRTELAENDSVKLTVFYPNWSTPSQNRTCQIISIGASHSSLIPFQFRDLLCSRPNYRARQWHFNSGFGICKEQAKKSNMR
jgi:hypothetical protein